MIDQHYFKRKTHRQIIGVFINKVQPDCLGYRSLGDWHDCVAFLGEII